MADRSGTPLWLKIAAALVAVGFFAGGYGAIKTVFDNRAETKRLEQQGVEEEANVLSVSEFTRNGRFVYNEISVSYEGPGDDLLAFGHVQDCEGHRIEPGTETVDIEYLPDDTDVIQLVDCKSSFDSQVFPGIAGGALIAFGLFMLWRLRHFWTS